MRKSALPALLMSVAMLFLSCVSPDTPEQRQKAILATFNRILEEFGGEEKWPYGYHPVIYAAWIEKGKKRVDSSAETFLREAGATFWALRDEIESQAAGGAVSLDKARFLELIEDESVRFQTSTLMDEGVLGVHAFARACVQSGDKTSSSLPVEILKLLGKLYTGKPYLLDVPSSEFEETDDTRWRDWLHEALAACGLAGVLTVLDFDMELEGMQDEVQADFWTGRLSIAYSLRSIQLAKAEALEPILRELAQYRAGGKVRGFHRWMYYDLGFTLHDEGGLFPYTDEQKETINDFLRKGLVEGPLGDGEEALTIAEELGKSPSLQEAARFLSLIDAVDLPCERRKLGYLGLAQMFLIPVENWLTDPVALEWLRSRVVHVAEMGTLPCGNQPLFRFYEAVLSGFSKSTGPQYPGSMFTVEQLVRIHEVFVNQLGQFVSADDRASALYLLISGLFQPEFMMRHSELARFRGTLLRVHADWATTTTFEEAKITPQDFQSLLDRFRDTLGEDRGWE